MKTYTVELTERQAAIVSQACELVARLGMNQVKEIFEYLPVDFNNIDYSAYHDDQMAIENILKKYMKKPPYNDSNEARSKIAWDLHTVIRKEIAWEHAVEEGYISSKDESRNWNKMMGVHYDDPMKTSDQPLAKVKVENK